MDDMKRDDGRWFDKLTMIGKNPFALSLSKGHCLSESRFSRDIRSSIFHRQVIVPHLSEVVVRRPSVVFDNPAGNR